MEDVLDNHERIALQFSGGKDSLALLHLMRPFWDRLTVYWLDTGDAFPETEALVEEVAAMVPNFQRIQGRQPETIELFGIPSDLVPVHSTPIGVIARRGGTLIQDRYSCCMRSLMLPMHERMQADGITLVVRGQKNTDPLRAPVESGHVEDGIEYQFPLQDWSDEDVLRFLAEEGVEIPRFYQTLHSSPDCKTCSAYWEEGRAPYLKEHHPEAYEEYQRRLNTISDATAEAIQHFNREIS
ncbi:phosphoadenosine phosphosulfate reductase domain-containing protein [Cupriavidus metallidurans]